MSDDDEKRLASGWGRRPPRPPEHDWSSGEEGEREKEAAEDLDTAGEAGPITGRASTRKPQDIAPCDTLGGPGDTEKPRKR